MQTKEVLLSGDFRYAYRRFGDPVAPAIILLMGPGMSMDAWPESLISGLLAEGFQVITPDNRDSGDSTHMVDWHVSRTEVFRAIARALLRLRVQGEYGLEDMALDLERLLDALGIRRAHVCGISLGGMIGQVFACQCPNRTATLTSISSAVGNPRTGFGRLRAIATLLKNDEGSGTEVAKAHVKRVLEALAGERYRPSEAEIKEALDRSALLKFDPQAVMRQIVALLVSGDRSAQVRQIRVPSLVIHGTSDPLLPFAAGAETARLIPDARLEAVEGLGHSLPLVLVGRYVRWIASHCHAHPA